MQDICKQQEKTEVIAGFEPTGHYWFTLGDHLKRQGHKLAIVNPFHVKRTKELDDNSPTKNDRKDTKTIASSERRALPGGIHPEDIIRYDPAGKLPT